MRSASFLIRTTCIALGIALSQFPGEGAARALVGTTDDGNLSIFMPNPAVGLPNPELAIVSGLPAGARPHGSAIVDVDRGLVADFNGNRVFVVGLNPAQLVATIPTPSYRGLGTLAVSPDRSVALASGFEPILTVIRAPFGAGSAQNDVALPAEIAGFATQNIAFDAAGRAYVRHIQGISVIDPPYQTVAFTVPIPSLFAGGIAVSADGSRLLTGYVVETLGDQVNQVPRSRGLPTAHFPELFWDDLANREDLPFAGLDVLSLPLTPGSTPQRVVLFRCLCFPAGMVITPDGQRAVMALLNSDAFPGDPLVFSLPAPFTDESSLEELTLPDGFPVGGGFEDIGISVDGSEVIIVGQSASSVPGAPGGLPALHIRAPFTAAGAQLSALELPGGRGAGSVRYAPAGTLPPPPAPVTAIPVPVDRPWAIALLILLLVLAARYASMRVRPS